MEKLDIEKIKKEFRELTEQLGKPEIIKDADKLREISKARARCEKLIEKSEKSAKLEKEINLKTQELKKRFEKLEFFILFLQLHSIIQKMILN